MISKKLKKERRPKMFWLANKCKNMDKKIIVSLAYFLYKNEDIFEWKLVIKDKFASPFVSPSVIDKQLMILIYPRCILINPLPIFPKKQIKRKTKRLKKERKKNNNNSSYFWHPPPDISFSTPLSLIWNFNPSFLKFTNNFWRNLKK